MHPSFDIIRTGKRYVLTNYGETWRFEVVEIFDTNEFKIKMLDTLEVQFLSELIAYGKGADFDFDEL